MERNRKNVILACLVATNFASTSIVAGEIIVYDPVGGTTTSGVTTIAVTLNDTVNGIIIDFPASSLAPNSSILGNNITIKKQTLILLILSLADALAVKP